MKLSMSQFLLLILLLLILFTKPSFMNYLLNKLLYLIKLTKDKNFYKKTKFPF